MIEKYTGVKMFVHMLPELVQLKIIDYCSFEDLRNLSVTDSLHNQLSTLKQHLERSVTIPKEEFEEGYDFTLKISTDAFPQTEKISKKDSEDVVEKKRADNDAARAARKDLMIMNESIYIITKYHIASG